MFASSGLLWGVLWDVLEASRGSVGRAWERRGPSRGNLEASWCSLEPSWTHVGPSWRPWSPAWAVLDAILGFLAALGSAREAVWAPREPREAGAMLADIRE